MNTDKETELKYKISYYIRAQQYVQRRKEEEED